MVNISILVLCAILLKASATDPQVYEDVDDQMQIESNTRVVRDPFNQPKPRLLQPQAFQFSATTQQDPRKTRYMQQQLVDLKNLLRNRFMNGPTRGRSSDLVRSSSTINENYQASDEKNNGTIRKTVTSRKLRPSSYFEDQGEKIKRQDSNHIIYVNPEHIRDDSEEGLKALNALVGQNPNHQLEGLKRLLGTQPSNLVLPLIKGPYPTAIPNHSKLEASVSIDDLQAELDEAAQAQLTDALAHAQQQALAHVEAQHQAIAKAKEDAQKKALAQIALHNQGLKAENLPHPLALRLKQEVVPAPLYAPHHFHHNQAEEVAQIPINPNLKKISITKTHSITALQSPTTYQQAVLETQPEKHHHLGDADVVDDHQYAARYAFGYKIRDAKMGNDFGHEEKRDGENAKGIYHVLLPDGRMQKVEYYVDPSGYHAKVTYENLAHH